MKDQSKIERESYFAHADSWAKDRLAALHSSRRTAWVIASVAAWGKSDAASVVRKPVGCLKKPSGPAVKLGVLASLSFAACAIPLDAQQPFGVADEGRVRQIEFQPNRVFAVTVTPRYQLTINFAAGEHVQTVALGDVGTFQVTTSRNGAALYLKVLQLGRSTNMSVATDQRRYTFTLTAAAMGERPSAFTIDFRYPRQAPISNAPVKQVGAYKLAGHKSLWPTRITDDGEHVFIDWPANVDLPAIYALDGQGRESLINGMMRGGRMVVDEIATRLVFRLDKTSASATRYIPTSGKQ